MERPDNIARDSISLLSEEQLLCSICLDVFTDPVTTPCGHNFCKSCLTQCWEENQHCYCPLCKEKFTKKPELKINTTLREVADHFRKKSVSDKPEVLCDVCTGEKVKAIKSCPDCGLTFCRSHLEPHTHVPKFTKHKLINPVENLEDYICQKHERALELFCRDDQTCVCQFCTEGDHKNHNTVPIEEESRERKVRNTEKHIDGSIGAGGNQSQLTVYLGNIEREKADSVEVFTALIQTIERSQAELLKLMEEKQKAAEMQTEELIKELEQEITVLQRRDTELEKLSKTEDHLHLLQVYSSMFSLPHTKNWTEISINTDLSGDTVRTSLSQLQQSLNEKLTKILNDKLKEAVAHDSSSLLSEEQLLCPICLDVFTDPVTTSCGHNFCKSCLTQCWEKSQDGYCPLCKEKITKKPELKINTTLREVADYFKKKSVPDKPEVLCDVCTGEKVKAMKSCLDCGLTFCKSHLEPHNHVLKLTKHKLINPVENMEDYICQKHERALELFCRGDQTCVCQLCTKGDHKTHNTVSIEEEIRERKTEELIKELEQEVTVLQRRDTEQEKLSHTEDHLHLLQVNSSMFSLPHTKNWTEISINTDLSGDTVRTSLSQLWQSLNEKLSKTINDKLKEAVDVTLDPDSAHPNLVLSADGKQVSPGYKRQNLPDTPERFNQWVCVLGKQSFSSGRFYYEVEVSGKTKWDFGVVRENINRKGKITVKPQNGFWSVRLRNKNQYEACDDSSVNLTLREKVKMVGVFVNYEEGLVSFYDVNSRSLIYSFSGQTFTEKLYPYFSPCFNYGDTSGLNQTHFVCLPLVSEGLKLVWVRSEQTNELDTVSELVEAFHSFPYPTEQEANALARYGISWADDDIQQTGLKLWRLFGEEGEEEEEDYLAHEERTPGTPQQGVKQAPVIDVYKGYAHYTPQPVFSQDDTNDYNSRQNRQRLICHCILCISH
ncbi:E3 ubiquitin-protein ligase TRIM39 [Silurus asotus]|uniref:E3 ubiquitin-protein ligase TRIM39 n=1 Tax=Silurus asotus TaxID=30991 RepID=A0AAD5FL98_SILAS|nr:E3 ubiquitin-protein ligase TRIM39 [Silurus asotus]